MLTVDSERAVVEEGYTSVRTIPLWIFLIWVDYSAATLPWINRFLSTEFGGDPDDQGEWSKNFPAEEFDSHDP